MWRLVFEVPCAKADAFAQALEQLADAVASYEIASVAEWRIEALFRDRPVRAALEVRLAVMAAAQGVPVPDITIEPVPDTDWLVGTQVSFPARRVGRYHVHGAHLPPASAGAVDLEIDAGPAFGSGEHATTHGCLLALDRLARRRHRRRVLDMGCGSGILAIAAARTWGARALAVDIDARAVHAARNNARHNHVARLVHVSMSDGCRRAVVRRRGPYDLILANILARPLIGMAPDLAGCLATDGVAVLSGLLASQERAVLVAYRACGLSLARRIPVDGWHTLVLARRSAVLRRPWARVSRRCGSPGSAR